MRYMRLLAVVLASGAVAPATLQVGHAQGATARAIVDAAASALGGADKIRAVKNITLHGYAQYASFAGTCWATIGLLETVENRTASR